MNEKFSDWFEKEISKSGVTDEKTISNAKDAANQEFDMYIKFQKPPDDFELLLELDISLTK